MLEKYFGGGLLAKEQSVQKQIQQLISKQCAGHFNTSITVNENKEHEILNYCCHEWTEDKSCIYFQIESEHQRCNYFEEYVLPLSQEIKIIYELQYIDNISLTKKQQREIKDDLIWANKVRKKCEMCGEIFPAKSNRQKYCDNCSLIVRKDKERNRQTELRRNKKNNF